MLTCAVHSICLRFQSPPREGRIHARLFPEVNGKLFPVTSPRGEDRLRPRSARSASSFQSPPREGRIGLVPRHGNYLQRFQSPPREGRIK